MLSYPLMIGWWEIVLIALIVLLFFGGKKVPELMKGLGKGVRSFKEGLNEVDKSIEQKSDSDSEKKSDPLGSGSLCAHRPGPGIQEYSLQDYPLSVLGFFPPVPPDALQG